MKEGYLSTGVLEVGEPGWRGATLSWAEATEPQDGVGSDMVQAPQATRLIAGLARALPKIDVKWEEVQQAWVAWQEDSTLWGSHRVVVPQGSSA